MLDRFRALFTGGEVGYGEWDQQRGAQTIRAPVPLVAYERHLSGEIGLGLVPVTLAGTCHFAAIDIDIDTIDHARLYKEVARRRLPLNVCRSKSGGAHLYAFFNPPISAVVVQQTLKRWAAVLGHPRAEIFPKQSKIGGDNVGNWINLPYFGGDNTTRYCVDASGAMQLGAFLDRVVYFDPNASVDEAPVRGLDPRLPPCLAALSEKPLPEGAGRNQVLFNIAVFYRKSSPSDWQSRVEKHNQESFKPPLPEREVQSIVRSASRVKYQYTCEQAPIRDYCNKSLCQTLPYGVSHMPWKESDAFDELLVTNLRKVTTNPPRYILEVNGKDVELAAEDFIDFRKFRQKVYLNLDLMITPMKQPQWELLVRTLTAAKQNIEAPDDASLEGQVMQRFEEFLSLRERATSKEDLLRGLPFQEGDLILFRVSDFRRHLQIYKMDKLEGAQLYLLLRQHNAKHGYRRIAGKAAMIWSVPVSVANDQSEDFALPEFETPEEQF
jgi:hypothetical protein